MYIIRSPTGKLIRKKVKTEAEMIRIYKERKNEEIRYCSSADRARI